MKAIILAGGSGTRLWPLSRGKYPKQFLKLVGQSQSLFQMAVVRCCVLCDISDIYVLTIADYEFIIKLQIEELGYHTDSIHIIIEPQPKNTLPAIYNAVMVIRDNCGDADVVVVTSDHLIQRAEDFYKKIEDGRKLTNNYILIFGIKPTAPDTGFGYINPGKAIESGYEVAEFKEKPDTETATEYLQKGYYWNSGMLLFNTAVFEQEVKLQAPEVYEAFELPTIGEAFETTPNISVDYGVLEKTNKVAVLPLDILWDDLGSFSAFVDTFADRRDYDDNITFGNEILIDSSRNLIIPKKDKIYALLGVNDVIVVDQDDALLICNKANSKDVKQIVKELKSRKDSRADYHSTEYRPWGSFTILENGEFYKIKRLTVLPGKQLSYQMHYHRSEHWIVVIGTATVVADDKENLLMSNESAFIPAGTKHRLCNDGKIVLEVIEVQSGQYLGEDDVVRLEDDYNRVRR